MNAEQAAWYDKHATVQREVARDLATWIRNDGWLANDSPIVEVGCGSGFLTERLPAERVRASDASAAMLELARAKCPTADFQQAELKELVPDPKAELLVSSSALHWVHPFADAAKHLAHLTPAVAIAIMLDGTLEDLRSTRHAIAPELPERVPLPRLQEAARALRAAGFTELDLAVRTYEKPYESAQGLLEDLHRSGLTGRGPALRPEQVRKLVERLDARPVSASYRVGFFFGKQAKFL